METLHSNHKQFHLHNNNCCMILTNFKRSRAFKGRRFDQRDETGREH